jgi:alkanesulfonate monooxygenase SsuD/methylene tetrahydromethanopterin reductase-like flavin-dependent oxidoreductase (luciferase family)
MAEWYLFLPQVRLPVADIVARACHAEAGGFDGVAFIDHLEAPGRPDENIWEAMSVAAFTAAKTERLRIGHLVLCDAFRHPAVLAKQAVTLSAASGGRFELGLGAGSWPAEFARFDVGQPDPVARVEQLERHLTLITQYWGRGEQPELSQAPRPPHPIPLVLGGTGPRMMGLVRSYADWWNLPANHIEKLARLAPAAGPARVSVQQMVGLVRRGDDPAAVREVSTRRFGHLGAGLVCGSAGELIEHFAGLSALGAQRFYVWFADFAVPDTLAEFGETVIKGFPDAAARRAAGPPSAPPVAGRTGPAAPR